jgi:membrane-bound inhibitor of C-type lysozyme
MTFLLQKINELNVRVDNIDTTGGGTTDTTALQNQIDTNTTDISGIQTNKQDKLTAGDNTTIVDNVIRASGGDGGSSAIIGFWACGDGTFSLTIAFGQLLSQKMNL